MRPLPKLCVSVTEPTLERAREAARRAREAGAMWELRLDCLEDFDFGGVEDIGQVFEAAPGPAILTCRRIRDGGRRGVDDAVRTRLLVEGARRFDCLCDLELDLAPHDVEPERLVLSHHDFDTTPADLGALYEEMTRIPAAIYKIATLAADTADLVAHARLLARAVSEGRRLVPLAMGSKGIASRILGPAHGAAFTFCALERGREAAPGQPTLDEMTRLYRVERLGPRSRVYGLLAGRVDYSRSPVIQNAAIEACGLDAVYVPFEAGAAKPIVADVVRPRSRCVAWDVRGLSVTNPFKEEVLGLVDRVDRVAERVGAANTIVVEDGELVAYNTDVEGALAPIEEALGSLAGLRVAVIGAGGAARAVVLGLVDRGASVTVYARRPERARDLAGRFDCEARALDQLPEAATPDVLVNTTPLGTRGPREGESPVSVSVLGGVRLVYDLVYNPRETRLLAEARRLGCATLNGLPMLVEQAARQFELWTGLPAPRARMAAAVDERER